MNQWWKKSWFFFPSKCSPSMKHSWHPSIPLPPHHRMVEKNGKKETICPKVIAKNNYFIEVKKAKQGTSRGDTWFHISHASWLAPMSQFLHLAPNAHFPTFITVWTFSHPWHRSHVFPRAATATQFPVIGIVCMFSKQLSYNCKKEIHFSGVC